MRLRSELIIDFLLLDKVWHGSDSLHSLLGLRSLVDELADVLEDILEGGFVLLADHVIWSELIVHFGEVHTVRSWNEFLEERL